LKALRLDVAIEHTNNSTRLELTKNQFKASFKWCKSDSMWFCDISFAQYRCAFHGTTYLHTYIDKTNPHCYATIFAKLRL